MKREKELVDAGNDAISHCNVAHSAYVLFYQLRNAPSLADIHATTKAKLDSIRTEAQTSEVKQ